MLSIFVSLPEFSAIGHALEHIAVFMARIAEIYTNIQKIIENNC